MNSNARNHGSRTVLPGRQRGAITMFSAVLILILLTEMVIYATHVGLFEQRKSGNEMRQKQAFHAAELGVQHAQGFLLANVLDLATNNPAFGWMSDTHISSGGTGRWLPCAEADLSDPSHPCNGENLDGATPSGTSEPDLRSLTYFYSEDGTDPTPIPMDVDAILSEPTETVEVFALMCLLDINRLQAQPVVGCLDKDNGAVDPTYFVITLLARGNSECQVDGDGDVTVCLGEALVAQKLGSYGPVSGNGGPGVPLTSRSSFPPGGTAEVVPNPNGGGPGVPISTWVNGRTSIDDDPSCTQADIPIDPISGSWSTCEMHEWYGVDIMPTDYACPTATCSCAASERRISYSDGNTDVLGMDMVVDPFFPCDLFFYTFGEPKSNYLAVKNAQGVQVITDCSVLGPDSAGTIWIDGSVDTCSINANTTIGSPDKPVFLISAANLIRMNGGAKLYGVLFVTDAEGTNGEYQSSGTNTIYGAAIIDGLLGSYTGTFQIVYNDNLIGRAGERGSLGKIYGGWTDFHEDWR